MNVLKLLHGFEFRFNVVTKLQLTASKTKVSIQGKNTNRLLDRFPFLNLNMDGYRRKLLRRSI